MSDDDVVARCRQLAVSAHAGQRDQQGRDYATAHLEPIAAACALFGSEAAAAGWLHDIVEDTDHDAVTLEREGVPPVVIRAVESVTKRPGEPYPDLIGRACEDTVGRIVKLVDNAWNIAGNPGLADRDVADRMLHDKYLPARTRLLRAVGDDGVLERIEQVFRADFRHLLP